MKTKFLITSLSAAALMLLGSSAQAALTTYSTLAAFTAATTSSGTDTFTGLSITGATPSPMTRTAGSYSYMAAVSSTSFFGAGTTANPWLSTNTATDSITFSTFSPSVTALGANFFGSDINGAFASGDITMTLTNSLGDVSVQTITGATTASFLGFTSTASITSLVVSAVQPTSSVLWPTVDNFVLAQVAAVPEPETYALMFAGLGVVGFMARRRKS